MKKVQKMTIKFDGELKTFYSEECILAFFKVEKKGFLKILKETKNKKFKRGGRKWCIECAENIVKEIKNKL